MFDDRLSIRVGAVVTMVLALGVVLALQVDFRDLGATVRADVYLSHPGPLRSGADVQLAGRKIGKVESIRLVSSHEARRPDHPLHPEGGVVLDVHIRRMYLEWVRVNSEYFVNMKGIIGRPYLEIGPPSAQEEIGPMVQADDQIRGIDPARMENIIVTSFTNTSRFGVLMREIAPDLAALGSDFSELRATLDEIEGEDSQYSAIIASTRNAYSDYQTLSTTFAFRDTSFAQLRHQGISLVALLRKDARSIQSQFTSLAQDIERVRDHIPEDVAEKLITAITQGQNTLKKLDAISNKLEELAEGVANAQGTIGALLADPEFMDDAKKLGRFLKRHPWKVITPPSP